MDFGVSWSKPSIRTGDQEIFVAFGRLSPTECVSVLVAHCFCYRFKKAALCMF